MKTIDLHIHLCDPKMDDYVALMDKNGVEAAVVYGNVPGYGSPYTNEDILAAVARHPGRLYAGPGIDLRRPAYDCADDVERYAEAGAVAIKLFPNIGFDPNDDRLEPFWRRMEDTGLYCFSHCGWLVPCAKDPSLRVSSLLATPLHFEVPARRHPKLNFVFGHFGGGFSYLETITLLTRLPNCFADVCPGWGRWVWEQRMTGIECVDISRIFYGTDNAGQGYPESLDFWNKTMKSFGRSEAQIADFFYNNAAKLLKRG
ncbi:MAG TPA: amidohydrolase family protein [Candidatus Brocadiia bacterium]|nr:amidohydrolase family protein [Candidatus Brocadiia bacterium]